MGHLSVPIAVGAAESVDKGDSRTTLASDDVMDEWTGQARSGVFHCSPPIQPMSPGHWECRATMHSAHVPKASRLNATMITDRAAMAAVLIASFRTVRVGQNIGDRNELSSGSCVGGIHRSPRHSAR